MGRHEATIPTSTSNLKGEMMRKSRTRGAAIALALAVCAVTLAVPGALGATGDREVSVGSTSTLFSQNKQNEPAMAVDANHPNILAAGSNDNIDMEACNAGDPTTCPFTPGVGVSGIYFSFNNGETWTQPTYSGLTARDCLGPAPCTAHPGEIGTLPWYYENGIVSDGDPALAFGPVLKNGVFSWSNGSRLYYANLTSNLNAARNDAFRGYEAVAVSRTDNPESAAAGNKAAWLPPVIVTRQGGTTFSDKEQIWADNASSSQFFGTVYVCNASFRGNASFKNANEPAPLTVSVSHDGGTTWRTKQLTAAATTPNNGSANGFGMSGCTVRTDSRGTAYLFAERFASNKAPSAHVMFKSADGGFSWTKPVVTQTVVDPCFVVDPVIGRCVEDGIAGARNDLAASPSVDIANGAPTGADATNRIVDAWADGRDGLNHEHVMFSSSAIGGTSWTAPTSIETPGDRGYYAAPAISPNGSDVYVVYNAFDTPYRDNTTDPRILVGVIKHANATSSGVGPFSEVHRGAPGDPRTSSQNDLTAEFLGDYVYAVATRTYGAGVWNDTRNGPDCLAIDAWRMSLRTGASVPQPAPNVDCPANWGDSSIFGWTSG
jgi:hypothetical protein